MVTFLLLVSLLVLGLRHSGWEEAGAQAHSFQTFVSSLSHESLSSPGGVRLPGAAALCYVSHWMGYYGVSELKMLQ